MAILLDGKKTSSDIREELKGEVASLSQKGITPGIAGVLVGEDPGSESYINLKEKAATALGISSRMKRYPADIAESDLLKEIESLNKDKTVNLT